MHARTQILLAPIWVFICFILLGIAVAPTATSTHLGQRSAARLLNRSFGGKAEMQKASLSWFGNQTLRDVTIRNTNQDTVLHLDQVVIEQNLASLLWHNIWQAQGTFTGLSLHYPFLLVKEGQGTFNFHGRSHLEADLKGTFIDQQTFHMQLQGSLAEHSNSQGNVTVQLDSPAGCLMGSFTIDDFIQLQNNGTPVNINWKVNQYLVNTDKLHLPITQTNSIEILDAIQLNGLLRKLKLPLNSADWAQAAFALEAKADQLHLKSNEDEQEINLKDIQLSLHKKEQSSFFDFAIKARHRDPSDAGNINISGTTDYLSVSNGILQLKAIDTELPTQMIAAFLPTDKKIFKQLTTLFGHKVTLNLTLFLEHLDGPLQVHLIGESGSLLIDGFISNQELQLKRPLELLITASEQLGREVAQSLMPLFGGIKGADKPLSLTIAPEGFTLPLKDIQVNKISARNIKIDLGILYFYNQGELAKALRPYRLKADKPITLWCTPLYLSLNKGVATLQRMDVLINNRYPTALWGEIDLAAETLNMRIGLAPEALNRILNISLPIQDSMTVLPLKGKRGKLKLDTSELRFQIGSTLAQFLAPAAKEEMENSSTSRDSHIPAPTTTPLPWETGQSEVQKETSIEGKRKARKQSQTQLLRKRQFLLKMLKS